jgi:hypothetical protein
MDHAATTSNDPPLRPDEDPLHRRTERRWWPALAVLGVISIVVLGGFVTAAALSEPAGVPVTVGSLVTVQPPSGWATADTTPVGDLPFARITRGGGNLDVVVIAGYRGTADALADDYVERVLKQELTRLSVSDALETVTLLDGSVAQRFHYVGANDTGQSVEGEVTALVTPAGDGVVFDGWAPEGLLAFVDGDLHTMIDRAVFA